MGEVIQLQGDQRKDVQEFLTDKKEGLELDAKTIKVCLFDKSHPSQFPSLFNTNIPTRSTVSKHIAMPCSGPFFPVYVAP